MDLGYRSPEQAFQTLRAAIRGDLPRLEYRSLSSGFRQRNSLSQLSYREFREEWYAKNPWLKPRTPIKNLYFAGSEVAGVGVIGAMMGGILSVMAAEPRKTMRYMQE